MDKHRRKQFFVDHKVQGMLVARVIAYWMFFLLSVFLLVFCWTIVNSPPQPSANLLHEMWFRYGPALIASLLVLPMVIMDCIRASNTFVGPIVRLRRAMTELAAGEKIEPIKFRDKDYWQEIALDFNHLLRRIQHETITASGEIPEEIPTEEHIEEPVGA